MKRFACLLLIVGGITLCGGCSGDDTNDGGGGCPTTANCGCSNKKKSDCGGPCCKWIVGQGCKCN